MGCNEISVVCMNDHFNCCQVEMLIFSSFTGHVSMEEQVYEFVMDV